MTRFRMGYKTGVGPVLKVMKNNTDDPFTTPNTDYAKFGFNSEIDQLPYAELFASVPLYGNPAAANYWPSGSTSANAKIGWNGLASGSNYRFNVYIFAQRLFADDPNAMYFIRLHIGNDWINLYYLINTSYSGGDHVTVVHKSLPEYTLLSAKTPAGAWKMYSAQETLSSDIYDEADKLSPLFTSATTFTAAQFADPNNGCKLSIYKLPLPLDESAYPPVSSPGTIAGKKILTIKPGICRMARPGFDVDTATSDQMLFSENKVPLAVIKSGTINVAAGTIGHVALGQSIDPSALVDYQVSLVGQTLYLPPYRSFDDLTNVDYRIVGSDLQFRNNSDVAVTVRFYVMAKDSLGSSSGSAKVMEMMPDGRVVIRKPGTAGNQIDDVIYDSAWSYMPIVAQAYVPVASFINSDDTLRGPKMVSVNLSNDGSWKPYVMARLKRKTINNLYAPQNTIVFKDFMTRCLGYYDYYGNSSFSAKITDTNVSFYMCPNADRFESGGSPSTLQAGYLDTIGLRYYIFAVPATI